MYSIFCSYYYVTMAGAELANKFCVNCRLTSATERTFENLSRLKHMNTSSNEGNGDNKNTGNASMGYASSPYMTANRVDKGYSQLMYLFFVSRALAQSYKPYQSYTSSPPVFFQLQQERILKF